MKYGWLLVLCLTLCFFGAGGMLSVGCSGGEEGNNGGDADGDSDGDADGDSDGDGDGDGDTESDSGDNGFDCSECSDPVCIGEIVGTVLMEDGSPLASAERKIQICKKLAGGAANCVPLNTDEDGKFVHTSDSCFGFDFDDGGYIHFVVFNEPEKYANYAAAYHPKADEVSEGTFDIGKQYLYDVPDDGVDYKVDDGATVEAEGVSFEIAAKGLKEDATIRVFPFPLDKWTPPFVDQVDSVDVLYYFTPYFARFLDPDDNANKDPFMVEFTVDLDALDGWEDGDEGKVYLLGDLRGDGDLICDGEKIEQSDFVHCADVKAADGKVTFEVPRLAWIGIVKD